MLWSFLRHVNREEIQPTVVFLQGGTFEREVAGLGFETAVFASARLRNAGSFARVVGHLARLFRSDRPNLIVNWSTKTQLYGSVAATLAGMANRVVWWQHGIPDGHWLDRLATVLPTKAVVCCSRSATVAQQRLRPKRRVYVIPAGIEEPSTLSEAEVTVLRKRLGIPKETIIIGTVGRLQPWKGQDFVLRAIAELRRRRLPVHGLIVGGNAWDLSPGYEAQLHQLAHELAIESFVTFTGQVPDAGPYIQVMDVSVSASLSEGFGLVLLEAMARGVPVVAFNSGGPAEIIDPGRTGLLVPPGNGEALVSAIERLVTHPRFRVQLGERGLHKFRNRFTAERMTQEIESTFQQLARVSR